MKTLLSLPSLFFSFSPLPFPIKERTVLKKCFVEEGEIKTLTY